MNKLLKIFLLLLVIMGPLSLVAPNYVSAQASGVEYKMLAPLPIEGIDAEGKINTSEYISGLFMLIIGIAGALAVIMLMYGGIQYMSTDAISGKSEAKTTISNAIWGLLLAISAWLILNTINPKLVNFDLSIEPQKIASSGGGGTGGGGSGGVPTDSPALTQQQAMDRLRIAGITIAGPINLNGVRQIIVDEIIGLKSSCGTACAVVVTSATGGSHASGACSHSTGYKMDLRSNREGATLTNYIKNNYTQLPDRSDGAKMYRSPSGAYYGLESNHWDVSKCS